jgi:hypothetical protein
MPVDLHVAVTGNPALAALQLCQGFLPGGANPRFLRSEPRRIMDSDSCRWLAMSLGISRPRRFNVASTLLRSAALSISLPRSRSVSVGHSDGCVTIAVTAGHALYRSNEDLGSRTLSHGGTGSVGDERGHRENGGVVTRYASGTQNDQLIGGVLREAHSSVRIPGINPANEQVFASIPDADHQDVDDAVRAADDAFRESGWAERSPSSRAACIRRLADILESRKEELGA